MATIPARQTSSTAPTLIRSDPRASDTIRGGVRNGLIAGIAMAMAMMVLGAFDQGFFATPSAIWAFFAGPAAYTPHALSSSVVIGAMGHMMNSAVLGIAFAFIAARLLRPQGAAASILAGVTFALVLLAIMWKVVLPLGANGDLVKGSAALWIWIVGHAAFGIVGGFLYHRWR